MNNDRELLELAAKAAGYKLGKVDAYVDDRGKIRPAYWNETEKIYWNPLTDDGDALRLAVKLGLDVRAGLYTNTIVVDSFEIEDAIEIGYDDDPYAATRRAIREALAERDKQDVRCECCGYMTHHREHMGCIRAAYAAPVSAPKQEPVAIVKVQKIEGGPAFHYIDCQHLPPDTKLYLAPVRTKDLTDDEINELWLTHGKGQMMYIHEKFARAVIAKFNEKNK